MDMGYLYVCVCAVYRQVIQLALYDFFSAPIILLYCMPMPKAWFTQNTSVLKFKSTDTFSATTTNKKPYFMCGEEVASTLWITI